MGLAIYAVLDFRHSIYKDVTVENLTKDYKTIRKNKIELKRFYFDELKNGHRTNRNDTVYIQVETDKNPWLDCYYYKVVGADQNPEPGTQILTTVVRSTYNSNLFDMF